MKSSRTAAFFLALFFFVQTLSAQNIKTANEFLPHKVGDKFTPHHQLNSYFEYLAANAATTMRLEKYGLTNEDRPLQIAIFSSPANMARLEQIRLNNLRLAGMAEGQPDVANPVAIVWISMSVHGNEASGSEASMLLGYDLATQTDPKIRQYLQNTVVILDPSLNPDGYDRYTHWNRSVSNLIKNTHAEAREHREPWPGGRVNHYYYDLNRDWAWATQVETRQRLAVYHRWLPHVHPDIHEQGVNDPYYFAPAAEPMHELITPWQRDFQGEIGENNARHFDNNGWMYFTKEVFDLFYPSYGDTYPTFNGAIGMTYEQAGGPRGGRAIEILNGDTLTLYDRILHHYTTSLSTIEVSSKSAKPLVENFREYFQKTSSQPQGHYKAFVIRESNDPNQINKLCALLDLHYIRYGRVGAGLSGLRAFDYSSGKESSVSINPNDIVVSAYQPHSVLVQALFEPEPRLADSMTYDITAWALPFAHGLAAYALKDRLEAKRPFEKHTAAEIRLAAAPYSWCIHRKSLAEAAFISQLLQKGVKVRMAMRPFDMTDQHFAAGAFVINRGDNRSIQTELDGMVLQAALESNVALHPVFSGYSTKGSDLGSDNFQLIKKPEIALVYGDEADANAYGHTWFFFEQEAKSPVTPIQFSRIGNADLSQFTTLVFADGRYDMEEKKLESLEKWVRAGGRLVAMEGALKAFADKGGFDLKSKEVSKKDSTSMRKPYIVRQRDGLSDGIPGAIVQTKADVSHPLGFGVPETYFSLKTTADLYEMPANADVPIRLENDYLSFGFIGSRLKPQLQNTPVAVYQSMGRGSAVFFVDNPLFRSFWEGGKLLFANAVFF
jgi:Zinc carboxypeptidase